MLAAAARMYCSIKGNASSGKRARARIRRSREVEAPEMALLRISEMASSRQQGEGNKMSGDAIVLYCVYEVNNPMSQIGNSTKEGSKSDIP